MPQRLPWHTALCVGGFILVATGLAHSQTTNRVSILKTSSNSVATWTGRGTLQSAVLPTGAWTEVLEATNPHAIHLTNAQRFFRSLDRWGTRANLPAANSEMGVVELNGKIYVVGGYPASGVTVKTVQEYDVVSNSWRLTTQLPIALNHLMPAAANGKLYIIGGQLDSGNTSFTNTVFEFDPVTTNWTRKADMPTARSAGAAAVIGDRIYVAGGRPPRGSDFAMYNATSNTWTTLANLPSQRNHLAMGAIDGKIYVAGGRLGATHSTPVTNVLEMFDVALGTWSMRAPMPTPRSGVNGIAANGNFFVWGGEGPVRMFPEMEMYVPTQNRWYRLAPMPQAVHGVTGAAFVNGHIHMPGGGTNLGGLTGSTLHQVFWTGGISP